MSNGPGNLILFVAIAHAVLFFIDYALQSLFSKYLSFRKRNGIDIQPFRVSWLTTVFNRFIRRLGKWRPAFQKFWFSLGVWATMLLLPLAVYFLLQSVYILFLVSVLQEDEPGNNGVPFLEPAIPGINIPLSDGGYYVTALLICSIFHELGHAVAAVREGAYVNGIGVFLLLITPIIYVRMEGLENLSYDKQLRILCAGIWHNIILAAVASTILFSLPWLCCPFYRVGKGVQVVYIREKSPLSKAGGLKIEDVIHSINNCQVISRHTWIRCLQRAATKPPTGYCVSAEFVRHNNEFSAANPSSNIADCCDHESVSNICFEYLKAEGKVAALPKYSCFNARNVVAQHKKTCFSSDECVDFHCYRPFLLNGTKLTEIHRKNGSDVLFLGHPVEILRDVNISEFIKSSYLSVSIPNGIHKFCHFLLMFSGALAALNSIPCFHLDGHFIIRVLIDVCLGKRIRLQSVRRVFSSVITGLGSALLFIYTILVILSLFAR